MRWAVVGAEPHLAYNRVLLSDVLARKVDMAATQLRPASWWRDIGATVISGTPASAIDRARRTVTLADGASSAFPS